MKICICSAATANLEYQYKYTNFLKRKYCEKHGYDFVFDSIEADKKLSYHHRKDMILRLMENYDWVMWTDVDVWINDFNKSIEDLIPEDENINLVLSRDHFEFSNARVWHQCYINSGVLLFKSCEASKKMIQLWKEPPTAGARWMEKNTKLNDQPFLSIRVLFDSYFSDKVCVKNPVDMNWFIRMKNYEDKFILHAAGIEKAVTKKEDFYQALVCTYKNNIGAIPKMLLNDLKESSKKKVEPSYWEKMFGNTEFIPDGYDLKPTLKPAPKY